jgi:hypothetical protein
MTTITRFEPSPTTQFQFSVRLDGTSYTVQCPYNNYSPRYYFSLFDNQGNLVLNRPIVASPDNYDINLVAGYFQESTLVYRFSSQSFIVTP